MKQYRCKCGKARMWNSGEMIHDCEGCEECKTTFAQAPEDHRELRPHQFEEITKVKFENGIETITAHYEYCKLCSFRENIK